MMTKTITMPLEEYEQMQKEIERSKENNRRLLKNSIGLWYNEICKPGNEPKFRVDLDGICKRIREKTGKDYEFEFKGGKLAKLHTRETILTKKQVEEIKNLPLELIPDKPMNITINCTCNHKSPQEMARELAKNIQHVIDTEGR